MGQPGSFKKVLLSLGVAIFALSLSSGCTVSDVAECSADSDCDEGFYCARGGGVLVQDGVCISDSLGGDAGHDADADNDADADDDTDGGDITCGTDEIACDGTCVDTESDPDHCGGCSEACELPDNAVPLCVSGQCDFECANGFDLCDGACVDLQQDAAFCGACGISCDDGESCEAGNCELLECTGSQEVCGSQCLDTDTDPEACGDCDTVCETDISGAQPTCSGGTCGQECADAEHTLCEDAELCTDLSSDDEHCGQCGNACGANEVCADEECVCAQGFELCDGECVNTTTNPDYCGGCQNACTAVEVCSGGSCTDNCPTAEQVCGGGCHDLETSLDHCQSCDNACPDAVSGAAPVCTETGCDYECLDSGQDLCVAQGLCTDLDTDLDHCGQCGNQCSTDVVGGVALCAGGDCDVECADTNHTLCSAQQLCANLQDDDAHCGTCGNSCASGESCIEGSCIDDSACLPGAIPFGGGDGTAGDPWRICDAEHMNSLGSSNDILDDHFRLMDDLDLQGVSIDTIGDTLNHFEGTFNGGGHILSNLEITGSGVSYQGLFRRIGTGGHVFDLKLVDVSVTGFQRVGALVGTNEGTVDGVFVDGIVSGDNRRVGGLVGENLGTIENCAFDAGTVTGDENIVGGLVGANEGTISSSSAGADVSGSQVVGGLVGDQVAGEIVDAHAEGVVEGTNGVGGLAGRSLATIDASWATGNVSASGFLAGGLIGENLGSVQSSYATGSVTAEDAGGGLVGSNNEDEINGTNYQGSINASYATGSVLVQNTFGGGLTGSNAGIIQNSHASGLVEGGTNIGGLAGWNGGEIYTSHAYGPVDSPGNVGGLCGSLSPDGFVTEFSYWDIDTSGQSNSSSGEGLSTADFEEQGNFEGWDFGSVWEMGTADDGNVRPRLQWQP